MKEMNERQEITQEQEAREGTHPVTLEFVNISRIEYYFAEFLPREKAREKDMEASMGTFKSLTHLILGCFRGMCFILKGPGDLFVSLRCPL